MRLIIAIVLILACLTLCCGCFTRTVYVPSGKSVMLRQEIKGAKIWAKDASGKLVPGTLNLREGWFVLPVDDGK